MVKEEGHVAVEEYPDMCFLSDRGIKEFPDS
jgi:hypothetical protein